MAKNVFQGCLKFFIMKSQIEKYLQVKGQKKHSVGLTKATHGSSSHLFLRQESPFYSVLSQTFVKLLLFCAEIVSQGGDGEEGVVCLHSTR